MTGQPRRVLIVAWAPFFSGAERALLLMASGLLASRYLPFVAVGTDGELLAQLRSAGVPAAFAPVRHRDKAHAAAWLGSVARLAARIWRAQVDLVHANDAPSFQPGGYAARLLGVPATTHLRFPDGAEGFRWFLRPGFDRAVFVSDALRRDAIEAAPGLFDGRADVVHDGVATPALPTPEGRARIRRDLGLGRDEVVVALTGQISEVKGIWDFVEAAGALVRRERRCRFVVLGDDLKTKGALRRRMEDRVAADGLGDRFSFLGFRNDAPALIPAFDIVCVPSHVEPLGNSTLEAMAAGVPVVGSRVGGIPEMVVDRETGLLAPPRDPARLADAIGTLVDDAALRLHMGARARARAEREFSVDRHVRRMEAVFDDVLGPRDRS